MPLTTEETEKEVFNKVLKDAAKLIVKHRKAGLPFEIQPGELESIYRNYADIANEPLFKRFTKYMESPGGHDFFKKTIRLKLWEVGFRPKGWEE